MNDLERFISCLKAGAREECFAIARAERGEGTSVTDAYERILIPALNHIGAEWESNRSSTIDEHMASEIIHDIVAYDAVTMRPGAGNGRTALIGCVPGEQHALGAKMMANRLAEEGWTVRYYGASVPQGDLVRRVEEMRPDLLLLSLRALEALEAALVLLRELRSRCPDVRVMLGGVSGDDLRGVLRPFVDAFADDFAQAAREADRLTSLS